MQRKTAPPQDDFGRAEVLLVRSIAAFRHGDYPEAVTHARDGLELISNAADDAPKWGILSDKLNLQLIEVYQRQGNLDATQAALDAWRATTQRPEGQVDILAQLARLTYRRGDFATARRLLDEGASLSQKAGYAFGLAQVLRIRAEMLWVTGEIDQALPLAQQALSIFERLDHNEGKARTLNAIGVIYMLGGNYYPAITHWLRAINIAETLNDHIALATISSNLGEAYQQIYAMRTALFYHQRALEMSGDSPSVDLLRNLGVDLMATDQTEEGLRYLNMALEKARANGDVDQTLQVLTSLAHTALAANQPGYALQLGLEILTTSQPRNLVRHIIRAELILGAAARATGDLDAAMEYFHEAFLGTQQTTDRALVWQTHAALADVYADRDVEKAAMHHGIASEILSNIAQSIGDPELRDQFTQAPAVAKVLGTTAART